MPRDSQGDWPAGRVQRQPFRRRYTFKGHASIKAEPKISAPELAYYDAGNTVNYDSLIQADGHYWISYLSYSGARRYIAIN